MVLIIDGHNLLFRMFYGIPTPIKNTEGREMKGVIGFISSIFKYINLFSPSKVVVVFDSETSIGDKLDLYDDYKQNRKIFTDEMTDEENPFAEISSIFTCLEFLNIPYIEANGCEADDYIASLINKLDDNVKKIVISTDNDFHQLVNEDTYLYNPSSKILYDWDKVYQKLHVYPNQVVEYKSLVGDASDNISGVKSIGKKTAEKILSYGSIEQFLSNCPDDTKNNKLKDLLIKNWDVIKLNNKLICLRKDLDTIDVTSTFNSSLVSFSAIQILKECKLW